jgi:acetyl esterase/lipase
MFGGKDDVLGFGYGAIAGRLAERGLVVVVPNYRLSPGVKHPEHVKDAARAFAWAHAHVKEYGGRPDQLFACGHSAGGHLVSLLAADETYLKAEGLSSADVKGVISISGVYKVDEFDLTLSAGCAWGGVRAEVRPFAPVFGDDPEALRQASPLTHVRAGMPPFLLVYGGLDHCPIRRTTKEFAAALEEKGCEVETKKVPWRTHETVLFDLLHGAEPATVDAVMRFVEGHTR